MHLRVRVPHPVVAHRHNQPPEMCPRPRRLQPLGLFPAPRRKARLFCIR